MGLKRLLCLLAVLGIALGCSPAGGGSSRMSPAATPAPSGADFAVAGAELEQDARTLYARATTAALGTRDALDVSAQQTYSALAARGTLQSQVATATAWGATMQADGATATAAIPAATATASAQETATAAAAQATATNNAWEWAYVADGATATAVHVQATIQAVERATARATATALVATWSGWIILTVALSALIVLAWYIVPVLRARLGAVRRDERGDPPLLMVPQRHGRWDVVEPTRQVGPVLRLAPGGASAPDLASPEVQERTTKRAQYTDMAKGGRHHVAVIRRLPSAPQPGGADLTPERALPELPRNVPLSSILGGAPSWRRLALGVAVQGDGQLAVIRESLGRMVHVLVAGSSGWGKSVFLRSLAFQLAASTEPLDLCLADLEASTFAPFADCARLLYPVAENPSEAAALFGALREEMERRRNLYAGVGAHDLASYNTRAGANLGPIALIVDEATALLQDSDAASELMTIVLRGRKYGLGVVAGGQSFRASDIPTAIRDQFSTRASFHTPDRNSSRVVLGRSGAEALPVPGRAILVLPGRPAITMQAPELSTRAIRQALESGGPRGTLPEPEPDPDERDGETIRHLHDQGMSKAAIARRMYNYSGGAAFERVTAALKGV